MAVLIPGFALYHGLDPQQLLGMLAGGTTLMLLRLHTDALWMPSAIKAKEPVYLAAVNP